MSTSTLRAHLDAIRKVARGIRLGDLVHGVRSGAVPSRVVALTFDDAYAETLEALQTVLEEYELPATVFVPTAYLGREPWWERLHRALTGDAPLPPRLELALDGFEVARSLDEMERSSGAPKGRDGLVVELYERLRLLPDQARERALTEVEAWANSDTAAEQDPGVTIASPEKLVELAPRDLFEFGSHSASHPFLGTLPEAEQWSEIAGSKRTLEELFGRSVDLFSYPNGSWDELTPDLVSRAGYLGACASQRDVAGGWSNPYLLPRMWPAEDPDEVERMLRVWLA